MEQEFLDYLSAGYGAFMSGNDDRCQQLDDELAAKFTAREGDLVARCEQLKRVRVGPRGRAMVCWGRV